jgi:hypothetical protein
MRDIFVSLPCALPSPAKSSTVSPFLTYSLASATQWHKTLAAG